MCSRRPRARPRRRCRRPGSPSTSCPPLPGVTPATTFVPYARLRRPWKRPSLPVRPWTTRLRVVVDDDRHDSCCLPRFAAIASCRARSSPSSDVSGRRAARARARRPRPCTRCARARPRGRAGWSNISTCSTSRPALSSSSRHSSSRVVADVRRVAQPLGLLDLLADVQRCPRRRARGRDTRAISRDGRADVREVVRRDAGDDHVERPVRERQILGGADDVRPASRARGRRSRPRRPARAAGARRGRLRSRRRAP